MRRFGNEVPDEKNIEDAGTFFLFLTRLSESGRHQACNHVLGGLFFAQNFEANMAPAWAPRWTPNPEKINKKSMQTLIKNQCLSIFFDAIWVDFGRDHGRKLAPKSKKNRC